MAKWSVVVIIILVVLVLTVSLIIAFMSTKNTKMKQNGIIYPFSAAIDPKNTRKNVDFMTKSGRSQISCPSGMKINIIGAKVEVADPFGECSTTPSDLFKTTCGETSNDNSLPCSQDGDCAGGMTCELGVCVPKTCQKLGDCSVGGSKPCPVNPGTSCNTNKECGGSPMVCLGGTPGNSVKGGLPWYCYILGPVTYLGCLLGESIKKGGEKKTGTCTVDPNLGSCMACKPGNLKEELSATNPGVCVQAPLCIGLDEKYNNMTCKPGGKFNCKPRDASAYVAQVCNGLQDCTFHNQGVPLDPNVFGPYPCEITPTDIEYSSLPIVSGWNGMNSADPNTGKVHRGSYNQGYYVHGIYTCVLDEDLPVKA